MTQMPAVIEYDSLLNLLVFQQLSSVSACLPAVIAAHILIVVYCSIFRSDEYAMSNGDVLENPIENNGSVVR